MFEVLETSILKCTIDFSNQWICHQTPITYLYLVLFAIMRRLLTFKRFYFQLLFQNNQDFLDRIWFVATYEEGEHKL